MMLLTNRIEGCGNDQNPPADSDGLKQTEEPDNSGFHIWVDPEQASDDDIRVVLGSFSNLLAAEGGIGLDFENLGPDPEAGNAIKVRVFLNTLGNIYGRPITFGED